MRKSDITKKYNKVSVVYDLLFCKVWEPGRNKVVHEINSNPEIKSVLEVGVGTGITLHKYRKDIAVTGIDISLKMLQKSQEKIELHGLTNVTLAAVDAERPSFKDNSFDAVVAFHVVSVTPNPGRMMEEMKRVCKAGGTVFIVNHFSGSSKPIAFLEKTFNPFAKFLGWNSFFSQSEIAVPGLELQQAQKVNAFGYWQMLQFNNADKSPVTA